MESTYSTTSSVKMGLSSACAAAQSRETYHFSMTWMTFCVKSEGMEDTMDENRMHANVMGASTG